MAQQREGRRSLGLACAHFDTGRCRSCGWLDTTYADQVAAKVARCRTLLADHAGLEWEQPALSATAAFRNKAKMVVGGTADRPTLGIHDREGRGVDLRDCPLHEPAVVEALPVLARWVAEVGVVPYDVGTRRGELKHLLVTASPAQELMVRLVLRSEEAVTRLRKHLPRLQQRLPGLAVLSVNLQPEHAAVLEGPREIVLLGETLPMRVNDLVLHLRPRSFFQTSTAAAAELYRTAARWVDEEHAPGDRAGQAGAPLRVLDLYCGVGGFALHLAGPGRRVEGVEISEEAVRSARRSADEAGVDAVFEARDATAAADLGVPDLVVVNPPRRGIGVDLAARLEASSAGTVVYSSCNPDTLVRDLAAMPSLRPVRARVLDMFPHTSHLEVLVLLRRV